MIQFVNTFMKIRLNVQAIHNIEPQNFKYALIIHFFCVHMYSEKEHRFSVLIFAIEVIKTCTVNVPLKSISQLKYLQASSYLQRFLSITENPANCTCRSLLDSSFLKQLPLTQAVRRRFLICVPNVSSFIGLVLNLLSVLPLSDHMLLKKLKTFCQCSLTPFRFLNLLNDKSI